MIVTISKNFGQNLLGWIQVQPNSIKIETYMSVSTARWSGTGDTNTLHFGLNRMVNWFIYGTFPEEHQAWEGSDTHGTTVQIIHIYIQLAGNSSCPQMAHGKTKEKLVWSHQREGVNSPLVVDISYKLSTGEGIKEQRKATYTSRTLVCRNLSSMDHRSNNSQTVSIKETNQGLRRTHWKIHEQIGLLQPSPWKCW